MKGKRIPKGYIDGFTVFGVGIGIGSVGLAIAPPSTSIFDPLKLPLSVVLMILGVIYIFLAVRHICAITFLVPVRIPTNKGNYA